MKLERMLAQGFVKIENDSRVYKQVSESLVVVYDNRGNGDYDITDVLVLHGKLTPEQQIEMEDKFTKQFGDLAVI